MLLRIRAERLKRKWTQTDLGFHARLSTSDVSRIESGRLRPYPAQAERLARALGVEVASLLEPVTEEVGVA